MKLWPMRNMRMRLAITGNYAIKSVEPTSCLDQVQNTARAFQLPKTSSIEETMVIYTDNYIPSKL